MPTSRPRRFARSALLLGGSAVLAALVALLSTPRFAGARIPAAEALPWPESARDIARPPVALLYVQSGCAHCSRAAVLFDSAFATSAVRAVIASNDLPEQADAYRAKLGLRLPISYDSAAVLIHALDTRSVPTLVLFHADGTRQLVVGFTDDGRYRALLAEFAR